MAETDIVLAVPTRTLEGRRTSDVPEGLFAGDPDERITLDDIRRALDDRAFGFLILVLGLPNLVPGPPGLSGALGVPIMLLAGQLALGWRRPWLPQWLLRRSVRRGDFALAIGKVLPYLRSLERVLRPRLAGMNGFAMDRLVGVLLFVFAIVLALPIPLGNLPPAVAVNLMALALIEQDGVVMLAGIAAGLLSIVWGAFLVAASWAAVTGIAAQVLH
jgi:hypothetical protein